MRSIVTVIGHDRVGIIAEVCAMLSAQNVNILKDKTAAAERKDAKLTAEAEATKARISGKVVRVRVSCGEGGRLFGSVTAAQAADALKEQLSGKTGGKDYGEWIRAFCKRKYDSDFSIEMTRSVREYLKQWNDDK